MTNPLYPTVYPVTYDGILNTLRQEGEVIHAAEENYNNNVKSLTEQVAALPKFKGIEVKQPAVMECSSLLTRFVTHVKNYFIEDGIRLIGGMAAVLTVAAIMRKYPNTFALPTLEGNWGVGQHGYSNRHDW